MLTGCRCILAADIRRLGPDISPDDQIRIMDRRERLQAGIEAFQNRAAEFLDVSDDEAIPERLPDGREFDMLNAVPVRPGVVGDDGLLPPEKAVLSLPSTYKMEWCRLRGLQLLVDQELELRQGQANDALHQLRITLGYKSWLFRSRVRPAESYQNRTRAWGDVQSAESAAQRYARNYSVARAAMVALQAPPAVLQKYQQLKVDQLKVVTTIIEAGTAGLRNESLPWFWGIDMARNGEDSDEWMLECKPTSSIWNTNVC